MYTIIQLNEKELPELQQIAAEFGIKNPKSFDKRSLVYQILDYQAIARSTQKNEDSESGGKKTRQRINKTGTVSKVYTADKNNATKGNEVPQTVAKPAQQSPKVTEEAKSPAPSDSDQANEPKQPKVQEQKQKQKQTANKTALLLRVNASYHQSSKFLVNSISPIEPKIKPRKQNNGFS